jgi:hypothetical protein
MQEKDIAKLPKGMTREKLEKIQAQIQKEYKE